MQYHPFSDLAKLGPGSHIGSFYHTAEEQTAHIIPFLRSGLLRGEHVIYIVEKSSVEALIRRLWRVVPNVETRLCNGQFSVFDYREVYTNRGRFSLESLSLFYQQRLKEVGSNGFSGIRVTAEMSWALLDEHDAAALISYEQQVNAMMTGMPICAMCQYDQSRFDDRYLSTLANSHMWVADSKSLFQVVTPGE